ncbi:Rho-binding antiterminator [Luteimonas yindakuii]|uniref:Rho-binding antiterminator n=1 Tax=Luteimonas yindakuii TaxID=2565782 RepID=UPI001422AE79|nr:Rho-binding antiterminator [Luteimonas yindakuii]
MDIEDDYRPISCDFHDILEAAATLRKPVTVEFRDAQAGIQHRQARIADLETRADGEYMRLDTGESIRFDRIVSIDGIRLADFRP